MKIHVIQPAVPKYRTPFFRKIMSLYQVKIYSTESDFLGVKTVFKSHHLNLSSGFASLFNKIFWHKGLPLFTPYIKGDIVVINGNPRVINYMLLFILLKFRGIKTVWWGHGWSAGSFGSMAKLRIKLMRLASAVLVYTDKERLNLEMSNCYALNNGLDSSEIKECIKNRPVARELRDSIFNLVFVGRITKKANFDFLLKSMSKVNKNVHLNVIGTGDNIEQSKAMSEKLGINKRVNWHGPIFDEIEIASIMLSSHAFIYTGSVGLSLIHGFNYGLPAIVHSNEKHHMPEYAAFENGVNGLSFEQNKLDDLTAKINELSSLNSNDYMELSENATRTITDSYNVDDMVLRFSRMIEILK